jgi:hypothetical protein
MHNRGFHQRYILALVLGAIAGVLLVAYARRTFPRMMASMMSQMMQDRMAQMRDSGCDPAEI